MCGPRRLGFSHPQILTIALWLGLAATFSSIAVAQTRSEDRDARMQQSASASSAQVLKPVGRALPADTESRTVAQGQLDGIVAFDFDPEALTVLGLEFVYQGQLDEESEGLHVALAIGPDAWLRVESAGGAPRLAGGAFDACGAMLVDRPGERMVLGNLSFQIANGVLHVYSTLSPGQAAAPVWTSGDSMVRLRDGVLSLAAELMVTEEWAGQLGLPAAGTVIGQLRIDADFQSSDKAPSMPQACGASAYPTKDGGSDASNGSDVIVADLQSVQRYEPRTGDITAYAVGTTACNIGTERADWVDYTNQHPVIIQNLYRLKEDRFEQIGMSWVKHGFYAVSQSLCSTCNDPTNGTQLGVGCSDPYSASLNGAQSNMSPRSQVNPHSGYFPYPWTAPSVTSKVDRRLQVHDADIDPAFNPGARYFIEGHYVHPDDSAAGNQDNSASYREVMVEEPRPYIYEILIEDTWHTQRQQAAIRAWQDADPEVVETDVRLPGEGLFILAAKATLTGSGVWRYSYSLQNLNSDRAARLFSVPLPAAAIVANIWFHDVDYHSGEAYDLADWPGTLDGEAVVWSTATYATNPNANALRYDTIYSFGFDTNVEPAATSVTIGIFKPGFPMELLAPTIGPQLDIIDCNANEVPDSCDIDCAAEGCAQPCGISTDCDSNGMPDECQPDCNANGIADPCDITQCSPGDLTCADCNGNTRPDGCEPDCDSDGIPDACDPPDDRDGDGITECFDRCPLTTPPGACACPPIGRCCWFDGAICWDDYPRDQCIRDLGVPDCIEAPCRLGCLVGDRDGDGDLDMGDIGSIQQCFSGPEGAPGYSPPSHECSINLDFDGDDDVDLLDWRTFHENCSGP